MTIRQPCHPVGAVLPACPHSGVAPAGRALTCYLLPAMQTAAILQPLADGFNGPAIVTRYLAGSSRIVATHKRGAGETERLSLPYCPGWDAERNHRAAAEALAERMGHGPRVLVARGHDAGAYYWVSVGLWQVQPPALALAACRELMAACAAGADAEALALPLALARDALAPGGVTAPPVVAGFALMARPERVEIRDLFGQALFSLPDTYSPVHAMACAQAAGWALTAEARGLAQRFRDLGGGEPSPDGVAIARAARGVA